MAAVSPKSKVQSPKSEVHGPQCAVPSPKSGVVVPNAPRWHQRRGAWLVFALLRVIDQLEESQKPSADHDNVKGGDDQHEEPAA